MHIFACKMQKLSKLKEAALRLISIFDTDRWSEQTSVEIQPLVNGWLSSAVMPCHCAKMKMQYISDFFSFSVPHFYEIKINEGNSGQHNGLMRKDFWQEQSAPVLPLTLNHTGCTSFSHALPASLLFNTVSFVMYQMQISTYCPHICCGRKSLPQWCSGCCPILSWINTGAICRLADTEMFVFQGYPPPSLYSSWPLTSQTQRGRDGKSLQLLQVTVISTLRAARVGWETWTTASTAFVVFQRSKFKVVRGPMTKTRRNVKL